MLKHIKEIAIGFGIYVFYIIAGSFMMQTLPDLWGHFLWQFVGIGIGFLYLRLKNRKEQIIHDFFPTGSQVFLFGLLLTLVWIIGQSLAFSIITNSGDRSFEQYQQTLGVNPLLYLLTSLVFAPISEELIFRGVLYQSFRDHMGHPLVASLFVSGLFALSHGTLVHLFVGIGVSLLSIIVYEMTGKIKYCIITHALHNFLATALSGMIPVFPFMYDLDIMLGFASLVIGFLIGILVRVYQKQRIVKEEIINIEEFGGNAYVKKIEEEKENA